MVKRRAAVILAILSCSVPAAAREVRVGLFQKELPRTFTVASPGGLRILDKESGRAWLEAPGPEPAIFEKAGNHIRVIVGSETRDSPTALRVEPLRDARGFRVSTPRMEGRSFNGVLEIDARPRELLAINVLPSEDYLEAVVAGELPRSWPKEAVKAQAVTARTYILKNRGRHRSEGYDFCDLAHCQIYKGAVTRIPAFAQALSETRGEVLVYNGSPIEAYFHSACGGHTASVEDVWNSPPRPYLRGQSDQDPASVHAYCRSSPDYRWRLEMEGSELGRLLTYARESAPVHGGLTDFQVTSLAPSGWVRQIRARFGSNRIDLSGYEFYLIWGRTARWHELKSGFFTAVKEGTRYVFEGRGLGHGIGLCQGGACGRARAGFDYRSILAHYFPDARLERVEF